VPFTSASRHSRSLAAVVTLSALGLAACGGAGHAATPAASKVPMHTMSSTPDPPPSPAVATNAVVIDNFAFNPGAITTKVGTAVTWTNKDEEPHSVVLGQEGRSPTLAGNAVTFSHTFTKPGTYSYNCGIHPFMHGSVTVTA
jgi:plastocyanin